ncbi:MAG TPA: hypothetical protein DCO75_04315 [Fibrobacteres bacterium]|nr:hypothetical protein [Fibrobacterota bacterium]
MKSLLCLCIISATLLFWGCETSKNKDFIGSAVVEAQTYQVATTGQGIILDIFKDEGMDAVQDELLAIIDTVPLILKINEINASEAQLAQTVAAKKADLSSLEFDLQGTQRECKRISDLADKGSLPMQQKDNIQTQTEAAQLRFKAGQLTLSSLQKQKNSLDAQEAEIRNQIRRCYVKSPCKGIILTRYKNPGEVALPGNPFYEIGKYDTMHIDFYVPQTMLAQFKVNQAVRIRLDNLTAGQKGGTWLPAAISWISNDAEFSPKNIQTRESRNELVFKIRALAPNKDAILKRGLPIEVWR